MQCLRVAARRLAKEIAPCASEDVAKTVPLSGRSSPPLYPPEVRHERLLLRLFAGRNISSTAASALQSKPPSPNSPPPTTATPNSPTPPAATTPTPASRLMSFGGPVKSTMCDVDLFFNEKEVLRKVPNDRLITPDVNQPYLFPDLGRALIRSGFLIPYESHRRNASTKDLFKKEGNVGVIKELNAFGIMKVFPRVVDELTEAEKQGNYQEVRDFMKKKLENKYGEDFLQSLPALSEVFEMVDVLPLDEEKIANSVVFLSRENTAVLILRMYQFLVKVVPLQRRQLRNKVFAILKNMPYTGPSDSWVSKAMSHTLLKNWIDKRTPTPRETGWGLVSLHRHGFVHAVERNVCQLTHTLSATQQQALATNPHTREDVMDLYEYVFPKFVYKTVDEFKKKNLEGELRTTELFHIPTWYD